MLDGNQRGRISDGVYSHGGGCTRRGLIWMILVCEGRLEVERSNQGR